MPPDDPLGRSGPTLDNFLRTVPAKGEPPPPPCPYAKKCTYGNKCKYHHPERGPQHKSVTERLVENARRHGGGTVRGKSLSVPLAAEDTARRYGGGGAVRGKSLSVPLGAEPGAAQPVGAVRKTPLARSRSGIPQQPNPFEDQASASKLKLLREAWNYLPIFLRSSNITVTQVLYFRPAGKVVGA